MRSFLTLALLTSFTAFAGEIIFDGSDASAWTGPVAKTDGQGLSAPAGNRIFSRKSFAIKPAKTIRISGEFRYVGKPAGESALLCFGFKPMSKDGIVIASVNINPDRNAAMTQTAADVSRGDSEVIVKNAATWKKLSKYAYIAFFVKKDFSDLPNRKLSARVKQVVPREDGSCAVTLLSPLKFDVPAGTDVRVHNDSSTYIYTGSRGYAKLTPEWKTFSDTIKGMRPGAGSQNWWAGTTAANVVFFASGLKSDDRIEFRNIKVEILD